MNLFTVCIRLIFFFGLRELLRKMEDFIDWIDLNSHRWLRAISLKISILEFKGRAGCYYKYTNRLDGDELTSEDYIELKKIKLDNVDSGYANMSAVGEHFGFLISKGYGTARSLDEIINETSFRIDDYIHGEGGIKISKEEFETAKTKWIYTPTVDQLKEKS